MAGGEITERGEGGKMGEGRTEIYLYLLPIE